MLIKEFNQFLSFKGRVCLSYLIDKNLSPVMKKTVLFFANPPTTNQKEKSLTPFFTGS